MAAPSDLIVVPPGSSAYPAKVIDGVDHSGSEQRVEKSSPRDACGAWLRTGVLVDIVRHQKPGGPFPVRGRGLAAGPVVSDALELEGGEVEQDLRVASGERLPSGRSSFRWCGKMKSCSPSPFRWWSVRPGTDVWPSGMVGAAAL